MLSFNSYSECRHPAPSLSLTHSKLPLSLTSPKPVRRVTRTTLACYRYTLSYLSPKPLTSDTSSQYGTPQPEGEGRTRSTIYFSGNQQGEGGTKDSSISNAADIFNQSASGSSRQAIQKSSVEPGELPCRFRSYVSELAPYNCV